MKRDLLNGVSVTELSKNDPRPPRLDSRYSTTRYYDLVVAQEREGWKIELALKPLETPLQKAYTGTLFEEHVVDPRVFTATVDGDQVGWIELGYEKWNNRMRVWEFLVNEDSRRMGVGALLMELAIKATKEKGARMLVLETQSCNVPAIAFYIRQGFRLIGFDSHAYSNEDTAKKEVRLEFGLPTWTNRGLLSMYSTGLSCGFFRPGQSRLAWAFVSKSPDHE